MVLLFGSFACVSLSVVAVCLPTIYKRTLHDKTALAWLWVLAMVMVLSASVLLIRFFDVEAALFLDENNAGWRWMRGLSSLLFGPASLVTFLLMIWLTVKRWPIDGLITTRRKSTGAAPQDGKV